MSISQHFNDGSRHRQIKARAPRCSLPPGFSDSYAVLSYTQYYYNVSTVIIKHLNEANNIWNGLR